MADRDDPGSLTGAYMAKRAQLLRFFTVRTGSSADAEDIVQEIFLRLGRVESGTVENAGAYLYKLGSNILLDRIRTRRRSEAREGAFVDVHSTSTPDGPASDDPSPEAAWAANKRLARVMAVVEAFPPQRRRVFTLHKLDGLSYADVSARLGVSKSAVEKHMIAALRQLAELADDG